MRVKICGMTNLEDALLAVELGASALGFNFYEKSQRYISPQQAADIIKQLPTDVATVGIFVNASLQHILSVIDIAHIQIAQLHGNENIDFCRSLPIPVIKAVRPKTEADREKMKMYFDLYGLLIDAPNETYFGGTGELANWTLAKKIATEHPIFLAGGLNEKNMLEAIATVQPMGVDICTGVESQPGRKSPEKMQRIFQLLTCRGNNYESA